MTSKDTKKRQSIDHLLSSIDKFSSLGAVGVALMSELDEERLLHVIAQAALELTGAQIAAFTLRPVDENDHPTVPSSGELFSLAALAGNTHDYEHFFKHASLGGYGLIEPIFHYGVPVLIADTKAYAENEDIPYAQLHDVANDPFAPVYNPPPAMIHSIGFPKNHPHVRSFLGVPLLNHEKEVLGGLLLGHEEPDQFTLENEAILVGFAAQATVALENARMHRLIQKRTEELQQFQTTDANRAFLKMLLNELPISAYLVKSMDARLVLHDSKGLDSICKTWQVGERFVDFMTRNHVRVFAEDGRLLPFEETATLKTLRIRQPIQQREVIHFANGTTIPALVNSVLLDIRHALPASFHDIICKNYQIDDNEILALIVHQDITSLKEAEDLKDDFIGIAAHELKSPLAVLRGLAQTLLIQTNRGHGNQLADWQLESIEAIDQSVDQLAGLTDDLLDISRLKAGNLQLQYTIFDLTALIQRVARRLQMTTKQHHISLHIPIDPLIVKADAQRIEQIVTNLVGNAIKYSPHQRLIDINVTKKTENDAQYTMVSIRDHGIGIPLDQQATIFQRFTRASNAGGISGTGLGLYLSQTLIEQHHGSIWFESIENQGSTFHFTLPLYVT